jgi:PST family polysaccharide transporter
MSLVLRAQDAFATTEPATGDLAARAVRGGAVSFGGQGVQFGFSIATTFVLARLLTPSDFGLVAMVAVIVAFGNLLREAGLSAAVVQARTISRDQCSALFRVNLLASVVLGAVVSACGPAIAHFYGHPELTWITVGLGLPLILDGLATQHLALLRRNMKFTALMIGQVGFQASYFVGAVATAALGFGYWSLVFGNALGVAVAVTLAFSFCHWLPSRPAKGTSVRGLLRFGGHVLGSNIVNYFSGNTDNILVGRFLGAVPLGLYSRAFNFFALPLTQIREPIQRVGLPALRHLVDEPERFRRYFLRITGVVATLSFPLALICIIAGDFIVRLLLGPQWLGAVTVFRILGAVMLINPVVTTIGLVQLSTGQSRRYLHWNTITAVVFVASFVAGLHWGIVGVAASYAVANYLLVLPAAAYGLANSSVKVRDMLSVLLVPLATSGFAAGVALLVDRVTGRGLLGGGLSVVAFLIVYCGVSLMRPSVRDLARRLQGPRGAMA